MEEGWDPEAEEWERLAIEWLATRLVVALEGAPTEEDERLEAEQRTLMSLIHHGYFDYNAWVLT